MDMCQISCLLIHFESSFQGLKQDLWQDFLPNFAHFYFFSLIICIINDKVLQSFKYKYRKFNESIYIHSLNFLVRNSFISGYLYRTKPSRRNV